MGVDSIKSLLFAKKPLKYTEKYFPLQSLYANGFKKDLTKIVVNEILKEFNSKITKAYVCLPTEYIKEEVRSIKVKNSNDIHHELTEEVKGEIKGKILELRILDFEVDGYKINKLDNHSGKEISANIYCIYCDKIYYNLAKSFFNEYPFKTEFVYKGELVLDYAKEDCLIIDSGYEVTRFYEIENKKLKSIKEIKIGESKILMDIMDSFNLSKDQARLFKGNVERLDLYKNIKEETERILESYKKYFLLETKNAINRNIESCENLFVLGENAEFLKYILDNEKEFEVADNNFTNALLIYAQKKNI